jgi:chromosome segregation ATPase
MSKEETDLATHVELCAERYARLEEKFATVEHRIDKLEAALGEFKSTTQRNLTEIKDLITTRMGTSYQAIIGGCATVIVSLIGFLGYILTHIK